MLPDNRLSAILCTALEHLERQVQPATCRNPTGTHGILQSTLGKAFVSRVCRTLGLTPIEQVILAVHCCSAHSQSVVASGTHAMPQQKVLI
jgi:hypothetical protein